MGAKPGRISMKRECSQPSWGIHPQLAGVFAPETIARRARIRSLAGLCTGGLLGILIAGCGSKGEHQAYDPVALGMASATPFYDDGETQIYQVKRAVSLPVLAPTPAEMAGLATAVPPYPRTPWITKSDVRVQVSWTVSNLDAGAHNVEILVDPWNEFARYVPGFNVGAEKTQPDLSGIDLLIRVDGLSRKSGIFTFDDMDELATDLATVENIIARNPPPAMGTMPATPPDPNAGAVNGLINHTFEIHNRSSDNDRLVGSYVPPTVAGLVGFDLGLRAYEVGKVAIEILVEIVDGSGNRVNTDGLLKTDGTMWMAPEMTLTAPTGL
jgi:hypothetical protein